MVCGTFTINRIASADVDGVVQRFNANDPPPLSVTKAQDADGTWTVTARFPPCPENMTHSSGAQ